MHHPKKNKGYLSQNAGHLDTHPMEQSNRFRDDNMGNSKRNLTHSDIFKDNFPSRTNQTHKRMEMGYHSLVNKQEFIGLKSRAQYSGNSYKMGQLFFERGYFFL